MMQSKLHQEEEEEEKTKVWQCDNYDKIMSGEVNKAVSRTFASTNGSAKRVVNSQKELVTEFMKILSLAHSCETEQFTDKDGNKQKFYNGPSPDEVALVEFASSAKFDCLGSTEEKITMAMHNEKPIDYTKFKAIEFTSDRKRMSVLIQDPTD